MKQQQETSSVVAAALVLLKFMAFSFSRLFLTLTRCKKYCLILKWKKFIKGLPKWLQTDELIPTPIHLRRRRGECELQIWFMFAFLRNLTLPDKSQLFLWLTLWGFSLAFSTTIVDDGCVKKIYFLIAKIFPLFLL